jgi:hypothetical protein
MEREWETPQSDATTRVCEKKRGDGRRKKLRPPLQHQSPSPLGFSAVLIERLNREVKNPIGQNVITTFRQQNGRRLYIHQ